MHLGMPTEELEPVLYDIIGDIHGHKDELIALLRSMGYENKNGAWRHSSRQAIFVGDFIDRGPYQLETIDLVRRMLDAGSAQAVMGNHEFNAIAWFLVDDENPDAYLRPHTEKNHNQHEKFLDRIISANHHKEIITWALSLPLWLELNEFRVIHACWHDGLIDYLRPHLAEGNRLTEELVASASRPPSGNQNGALNVFNAVGTLLKGMEVELPDGLSYFDKDGHQRHHVRTKWWDADATTYPSAAMLGRAECKQLPTSRIPENALFWQGEGLPVFVGHYWLTGQPAIQNPKVAILDYSVANKGKLVAYRWNGEEILHQDALHFVN